MGVLETPASVCNLGRNATETGRNLCHEHGKIIAQSCIPETPTKSKSIDQKSEENGRLLGIYAKSSTPPCAPRVSAVFSFEAKRAQRYQLLDIAQRIIVRKGKSMSLKYPRDYHKTAKCMYTRLTGNPGIALSKAGRAHYVGLVVCAKPFTCPVCAPKIQERRRQEIAQAFDWSYENGHKVIMVTFTFPHNAWQKLEDLLVAQTDAYTKLRAGNPWKRLKDSIGYVGLIRSLEVTHGKNGWHPHTHEAWIVSKDTDVTALREKLAERWLSCCIKAGLVSSDLQVQSSFLVHSVHITDNCSTSDYLAKQDDSRHWGADREIASGAAKQGIAKGSHPFQFLENYRTGDRKTAIQSARLYIEFLDAMRRKAQVFWSRGLKEKVGVDVLSDDEAADESGDDDDYEDFRLFDKNQWTLIAKNRLRNQVLFAFETEGFAKVLDILSKYEYSSPKETEQIPSKQDVLRQDYLDELESTRPYQQAYLEFSLMTKDEPDFWDRVDLRDAASVCSTPKDAACVVFQCREERRAKYANEEWYKNLENNPT